MKILEVVPVFSDPFGGPVTVVRAISKELAKRHQVVVYTTTALDPKHDFTPHEEEVDGYRVFYFKRNLQPLSYSGVFGQLNFSCSMQQAVKENLSKFDVVHVHSWGQFPDVLIHHYATKYGVPYILQAHGSLSKVMGKQMLKRLYEDFFGYKLLRDASRVIALSRVEAEEYRCAGVSDDKLVVVPNALTLSEYADLPFKGLFRRRFGIAADEKVILYLGRLHETKGIGLLIRAYVHLVKEMKCSNTRLLLVGPDDGFLEKAKSIVRSAGVSDSVLFTGFVDSGDKLGALVDADVFVTPSFYGFPVTFLEACAVGAPIVTTTLGDQLDWINGNAGFVTPPTEYKIAEAIYAIVSDDYLHEQFSRNCQATVRSRFSIEAVVAQIEKVYEDVAYNKGI